MQNAANEEPVEEKLTLEGGDLMDSLKDLQLAKQSQKKKKKLDLKSALRMQSGGAVFGGKPVMKYAEGGGTSFRGKTLRVESQR